MFWVFAGLASSVSLNMVVDSAGVGLACMNFSLNGDAQQISLLHSIEPDMPRPSQKGVGGAWVGIGKVAGA